MKVFTLHLKVVIGLIGVDNENHNKNTRLTMFNWEFGIMKRQVDLLIVGSPWTFQKGRVWISSQKVSSNYCVKIVRVPFFHSSLPARNLALSK